MANQTKKKTNIKTIVIILVLFLLAGFIHFFHNQNKEMKAINDLIKKQSIIEKALNEEYISQEFTLDKPFVRYNPYGNTANSAFLWFDTKEDTKVSFEIEDPQKEYNYHHTFPKYTKKHKLSIHGLYLYKNNKITITAIDKSGNKKNHYFEIDLRGVSKTSIPYAKEFDMNIQKGKKQDSNKMLFTFYGAPVAFDYQGNVRYSMYLPLETSKKITKGKLKGKIDHRNASIDHPFLLSNAIIKKDHLFYQFVDQAFILLEIDEMGKITQIFDFEKANRLFNKATTAHHDMAFLDNDKMVVLTHFKKNPKPLYISDDKKASFTVDDFVTILDLNSGKILKHIDLATMLDPRRRFIFENYASDNFASAENNQDWAHVNSVKVNKKGEILLSVRNQLIMLLTPDFEIKWSISPHSSFANVGRDSKKEAFDTTSLLTAVDQNNNPYPEDIQNGTRFTKDFKWPTFQHDAKFLKEDYITVFDNAFLYNNDISDEFKNKIFSRGVVYKIDEKKKTIKQVWSFGMDLGYLFSSDIVSSFDVDLDTNTALIGSGHIMLDKDHTISHIIELTKDKKILFSAILSRSAYRIYKADLYEDFNIE